MDFISLRKFHLLPDCLKDFELKLMASSWNMECWFLMEWKWKVVQMLKVISIFYFRDIFLHTFCAETYFLSKIYTKVRPLIFVFSVNFSPTSTHCPGDIGWLYLCALSPDSASICSWPSNVRDTPYRNFCEINDCFL